MSPNRVLQFSSPIENSGLTCKYEYWRKPIRMREDNDVSRIPDDFSRLIILLAKILYAEHEDAPEVSAGAHEEYEVLMDGMIAAHLPDQGFNKESHSDADLVVVSE